MANVYISENVKQKINHYFYMLPLNLNHLENKTYVFVTSKEATNIKLPKKCNVIVVLEDDDHIIHQKGFNYIKDDPKQIANAISLFYCSPYYFFEERFINLEFNLEDENVFSYLMYDEVTYHIQYIKEHFITVNLITMFFYIIAGMFMYYLMHISFNQLIQILCMLHIITLISVYGFYYIFHYINQMMVRKKYMRKVFNNEFHFYCLSEHIEAIQL